MQNCGLLKLWQLTVILKKCGIKLTLTLTLVFLSYWHLAEKFINCRLFGWPYPWSWFLNELMLLALSEHQCSFFRCHADILLVDPEKVFFFWSPSALLDLDIRKLVHRVMINRIIKLLLIKPWGIQGLRVIHDVWWIFMIIIFNDIQIIVSLKIVHIERFELPLSLR